MNIHEICIAFHSRAMRNLVLSEQSINAHHKAGGLMLPLRVQRPRVCNRLATLVRTFGIHFRYCSLTLSSLRVSMTEVQP